KSADVKRMRTLPACIVAASIFALGVSAAAQTPLIGLTDTALPGGAYVTLPASSAIASAQQCSDDRMCLARTYRAAANSCELKAVVPHPVSETGAISGMSSRAPAFAQQIAATPAAAPETKVASADPKDAAAPVSESDASAGLLGGPAAG